MRPASRSVARRSAPLWRHLLGARLRAVRLARGEILTRVAATAGVSAQYLSEVERGRKDPSSEMIEAIAGALGLSLPEVLVLVLDDVAAESAAARPHELTSSGEQSAPALALVGSAPQVSRATAPGGPVLALAA